MHTIPSLAKSVLEKPISDFNGIIRELGAKNLFGVGKDLPLSWENNCHFLARDYTFCLPSRAQRRPD
jgi:hypothetical protein